MAFRPILAPLVVLAWAATAIISDAHATEHHKRTVVKLHHENQCHHGHRHGACAKHVKHAIGHHGTWNITDEEDAAPGPMSTVVRVAEQYDGLSERRDRGTLVNFFAESLDVDLDPRRTAWCAAFVNSVLAQAGKPTSGSMESTSFLHWGTAVKTPEQGDIVVVKGASRRSPTHVGFYVGSAIVNGRRYVKLLGGNQSNMVRVSMFPAAKIIGIRRAG